MRARRGVLFLCAREGAPDRRTEVPRRLFRGSAVDCAGAESTGPLRTRGRHLHSDTPTDEPTDRPGLRSAGLSVREIWPIAAHRWATPPAAMRISAATDRQTDERTNLPALRTGGPSSPHRCAQVGHTSPSDAHKRSDRPTDRRSDRRADLPQLCAALGQSPAFAAQRWGHCSVFAAQRCSDGTPTDERPHQQRWTCDQLPQIVLMCLFDIPTRCIKLRRSHSSQPNAA
jgi:hypothetical protein